MRRGLMPMTRAEAVIDLVARMRARGQLRGLDLHGVDDAVRDHRLAFSIDDFAARRRRRQFAQAVRVGLLQVLIPGEYLQVPQAEEDHAEEHEREHPEDRRAHGERRRDEDAGVGGLLLLRSTIMRARAARDPPWCTRDAAGVAGHRASPARRSSA